MSLNLLVVGRDGNGKSSTGNSILGAKLFKPSSTTTNSKVKIERDTSTIDGREVLVMEVSGLEYPSVEKPENAEDTVKSINDAFEDIKQALTDEPDGFQAMLICIKYGIRFTKQEEEAIKMIKATFGPSVIKDYGVIVMTYGDSFELDMEDEEKGFEEWCEEQTGSIQTLFKECDKRCVLFNNRTKKEKPLKKQRDKLLSCVNDIKSKYNPYTDKNFESHESVKSREELLLISELPVIEKETRDRLNKIREELNDTSDDSVLESKHTFGKMKDELEVYTNDLRKKDKGTGFLKYLFNEISITQTGVEMKIKIAEQTKCITEEQQHINSPMSENKKYKNGQKDYDEETAKGGTSDLTNPVGLKNVNDELTKEEEESFYIFDKESSEGVNAGDLTTAVVCDKESSEGVNAGDLTTAVVCDKESSEGVNAGDLTTAVVCNKEFSEGVNAGGLTTAVVCDKESSEGVNAGDLTTAVVCDKESSEGVNAGNLTTAIVSFVSPIIGPLFRAGSSLCSYVPSLPWASTRSLTLKNSTK